MNTIKLVIVVSIILVSVDLLYHEAIKTYGFVDGNNNGKDDVKEWWNSSGMVGNYTDWGKIAF